MIRWTLLLIAGWLAATVSGAAGFGGALLLLPVLSLVVGAKAAVPVLTLAQLLGNGSRLAFGWRDIRWRPALLFSAGAAPASLAGSFVFVSLPAGLVSRLIGLLLLAIVAGRRTAIGRRPIPEILLPLAGAVVGLLSGVAGSAGPLGAVVFLSLRLPAPAYVATEAVSAVVMHVTKIVIYGRYAAIAGDGWYEGLALGCAMMVGSWTGRRLVERIPERGFNLLVEGLLVVAATSLIVG